MRILVFAHRLEVGGTQTNAIDLAAALRDRHGHDVTVLATPGPMVRVVEAKALRFRPAPDARIHPSPARMRAVRDVVRDERPDVIHAWDWWQCLEAYYGVHLPMRVPLVVTDMMMSLTRVLPKTLPTTFGTPEMVESARAAGRRSSELLLPPVDVQQNAPGAVDPRQFVERHAVKDDEVTLVTVSRLSHFLKSDSLFRTVAAVRALGRRVPLRLLIVGEGAVRGALEAMARDVNAELGRSAVELTGELVDPRSAYAAADIVVGMGSSALRGMAFAKPVVVVGEGGFSAPFTPETAGLFYHQGMFGRGRGGSDNESLERSILDLAQSPGHLSDLGRFSREFVLQHFAVEIVAAELDRICASAVSRVPSLASRVADALRTAAVYVRERRFLVPSRDRDAVLASRTAPP